LPVMTWGQTVSLSTTENIVRASTNTNISTSFELVVEGSSLGSPQSQSSPLKVYLPIASGFPSGTPQTKSIAISNSALLPTYTSATSKYAGHIQLYIKGRNTYADSAKICFAGKKVAPAIDFAIFDQAAVNLGPTSGDLESSYFYVYFSLLKLGDMFSDIRPIGSTTFELSKIVFVFAIPSTQNCTEGNNPPDGAIGIYYDIVLSDKNPSQTVNLDAASGGDGRVYLAYRSQDIYKFWKTDIFLFNGQDNYGAVDRTFSDIVGQGSIFLRNDPLSSGKMMVKPLANNHSYSFAIYLVNRWQFATPISNSLEGRPQEIEEFLKKQSCYLLSAGFQQEHYVIEYFKGFRDQVLLKHNWGKIFVSWYYRTAPDYAPIIYKSPTLSALVRGLGYLSYFLFRHVTLISIVALLLFSLIVLARRRPTF
ncbi:MAG: CFI-box-CTERM domain-containing protein, partial [Pseudomonadota bacterium]